MLTASVGQGFGEISFGRFLVRICCMVVVRCQWTLPSSEDSTGLGVQDGDLRCWQWVLATDWNLNWDRQPEHLQWPFPITWAFVQPDLLEGVRLLTWSGAKEARWSWTALCDCLWNPQHHYCCILLVMSKSTKARPASKEGEIDPASPWEQGQRISSMLQSCHTRLITNIHFQFLLSLKE